ncbi:hypothetical protein Syun_030699 [Stephania yunnanensis]|uniref:Uncharacterized protein n=1 Tax=Stephania yunnanensis TaxID=152371 RepID=A0AAP0DU09_9MAGN
MGTLINQISVSLDNLINEVESPILVPYESMSTITLRGVKEDEYWFKSEDNLEISLSEPDIMTVEVHEEEAKKKIEVTLERLEELEEERKEDETLILVKTLVLPRILIELETGVEEKEHFEILYADNTFMLDGLQTWKRNENNVRLRLTKENFWKVFKMWNYFICASFLLKPTFNAEELISSSVPPSVPPMQQRPLTRLDSKKLKEFYHNYQVDRALYHVDRAQYQ